VIRRLDAVGEGVELHLELEVPASGPVRYDLVVHGDAVGAGFVVVRADDIARPRHDRLEFRADGIWTELVEEEPGRWTLGLEAFGIRVDDPTEDLGERVAVGYDLEYESPSSLHGELLVADAVIAVDLAATFR
jgi:hypothetical protein